MLNKIGHMHIWHMHTGSAPECQDTPRDIVKNWFKNGNATPNLGDAYDCWENLLECYNEKMTQADFDNLSEAEYLDECSNHRCHNRVYYSLTFADVKNIILELLEKEFSSVKFGGKKYILSQDAYITGTEDNPYYEAYAYGMDYKTYLVKWAITADINSPDYDVDNSDADCDWAHPVSVERY